jgi:hypothetical protein
LIYKPAKSATQSRCAFGERWLIEPLKESPREVEPLMGWTSAGDPLSSLTGRLSFSSPQEASTFADQQGWSFEIITPQQRRVRPKSYLDNFNADGHR